MWKKFFVGIIAVLFVFSIHAQKNDPSYVLLISFDGFRHDYVQRFDLPNFKKFIAAGASAEALIPSFPSKTFPNHYSIVTGMYPGHHGLVDNEFFDTETSKPYGMRIREAVVNPNYYGGTALWTLCKSQGLKSASFFWVGSEVADSLHRPDYFYKYDEKIPFETRVDQVVKWFQLPEDKRPRLVTLYFSSPDHEGHLYGPVAEETQQKLLSLDSLMGNIDARMSELNLPINIIIVSDHGMYEMTRTPDTFIYLSDICPRTSSVKVANGGTQAHVYTKSQAQTDSVYQQLHGKFSSFDVLRRPEFPKQWHYDNGRSGELLLVAKPGKYFTFSTPEKVMQEKGGEKFGVHGYDPGTVKEMNGIFYAKGPNIKAGKTLPPFENIHVYPLVTAILKLASPPDIDGDASVLKPIYQANPKLK